LSINETYEGNEVVRPQYAAAIKKRTIWVNDRKDVEIVIVNKALDLCRVAILCQETIGEVFVNLFEVKRYWQTHRWDTHTIVAIHSRAWTVLCQMIAGLLPEPLEPKIFIPSMSRPCRDLPELTIFALWGNWVTKSLRKVKWSS